MCRKLSRETASNPTLRKEMQRGCMARACHWGEPVTEHDLEQACIGWFRELGWGYAPGEAISPGGAHPEREHHKQVILHRRLQDALSRLNPELPAEARERGGHAPAPVRGAVPGRGQPRDLHLASRRHPGRGETGRAPGDPLGAGVRLRRPGQQRLADRQPVHGQGEYDLPGGLGGLRQRHPARACWNSRTRRTKDTDVTVAFHQIQNYQAEIQQLFEPNLCCVISDGTVARVGSITADEERFMPWREAAGIEDPEQHLELEVLVSGLFARETLLDYLRYFVAFQNSSSGAAKLIAGYHQYRGVRKAAERALEAATRRADGKGGVMWFTQGSGKSLIALFYVCLLRERPSSRTRRS